MGLVECSPFAGGSIFKHGKYNQCLFRAIPFKYIGEGEGGGNPKISEKRLDTILDTIPSAINYKLDTIPKKIPPAPMFLNGIALTSTSLCSVSMSLIFFTPVNFMLGGLTECAQWATIRGPFSGLGEKTETLRAAHIFSY